MAESSIVVDSAAYQAWNAAIPITCKLAEEDCSKPQKMVCNFLVPAQGYLFWFTKTILQELQPHAHTKEVLWFTTEVTDAAGTKVDWEVPVYFPMAVILDKLAAVANTLDSTVCVPLNLVAHFSRRENLRFGMLSLYFPEDPETGKKAELANKVNDAETLWMQQLKASVHLRSTTSGTQSVLQLKPTVYTELTNSVQHSETKKFFAMKKHVMELGGRLDQGPFGESMPVMFHLGDQCKLVRAHMRLRPTSQDEPGELKRFGHLLKEFQIAYFHYMTEHDVTANEVPHSKFGAAVVSGAQPYCSTPLEYMNEWLVSADFCLHVVVHTPSIAPPKPPPPRRVERDDDGEPFSPNSTLAMSQTLVNLNSTVS